MRIKKKTLITVELVVWFGFLNGLFLAIGINPKADIFAFMGTFIAQLGGWAVFLFGFVPTLLTLYILYYIYKHGGTVGFLAVFLGFLGGFLILADILVSVGFLILAWIIGSRAAK